jgi:dTMP kinase
MYLITIEGGDGSGKGLASRIICELLERDGSFTSVELTAEPRRRHPLGRAAIDAVKEKKHTPEHEAKLFALDRLDHGLNWMLPRLSKGSVVVCDRNIHSSLVYQGIVGGLGTKNVGLLNSGALIPDLCVWVDCDPEIAIMRIRSGSLREASPDKSEYFETLEIQKKIRSGYEVVLSGQSPTGTSFDTVRVVGPIRNESTVERFSNEVAQEVRKFLRLRPKPRNTYVHDVDLELIRTIIRWNSGQTKLPGYETDKDPKTKSRPWELIRDMERSYKKASQENSAENVPRRLHSRSIYAIMTSMTLISSGDTNEISAAMGPSKGHATKVIRHLCSTSKWIRESSGSRNEGSHYRITKKGEAVGKLLLVLSPLRAKVRLWRSRFPKTSYKHMINGILDIVAHDEQLKSVSDRINLLYPTILKGDGQSEIDHILAWWHSNLIHEF